MCSGGIYAVVNLAFFGFLMVAKKLFGLNNKKDELPVEDGSTFEQQQIGIRVETNMETPPAPAPVQPVHGGHPEAEPAAPPAPPKVAMEPLKQARGCC